ncbi:uncharacterized protein N7529_001365 [Penicillium soppii]|uniref:uncharacterized protein n=1 Tax=Penicillium soppii TaxID=69789 RepID=UPI0025465A34|nr:uncharacterized protein N7529_001365 [Penicillium soppii]KAJ5875781.1 hypothetical protein N7529_001365 [Penicillium soppii]
MSLRKKIALTAALGLGVIAAATAVVKCAQIKGLSNQTDGTCEFPVSLNHHRLFQITDMPRETDATVPLVLLSTSKGNSKPPSYAQHKIYDNQSSSRAHASKGERPTSTAKGDSQESILNDMEQYHIRRTDEVYVEYEMQAPKGTSRKQNL